MKLYNAIKFLLEKIENSISHELSIEYLANNTGISQIHLQRIFKLAFGIPLARYIRLRKLSVSVKRLAFLDNRIIDIANEVGFEHEQSYIRAFKREFYVTPGQFRKSGTVIKTMPPFTINEFTHTSEGLFSVPDIVVMPEIYLIGKENYISYEESFEKAPRVAREFWENDRIKIKNAVNKDIYFGLTDFDKMIALDVYYLSGVQVTDIKKVPSGLSSDRLPPAEYLRFCYIGKHHYYDLNREVTDEMFKSIDEYIQRNTKHVIERTIFFERVDTAKYDGTYCYLEWFTPVSEKT